MHFSLSQKKNNKMMKSMSFLAITITFIFFNNTFATAVTYNVVDLGANPDGKTDSTNSFVTAWAAACGLTKPAILYVPTGRYLIQSLHFRGQCNNSAITIRIDGTLMAPSDYGVIGNAGNWLLFEGVSGVTVRGGILDGQGTGLWDCKASRKSCPSGATVSVK